MQVVGQDEHSYELADGTKVAKAGLSPEKRKQFERGFVLQSPLERAVGGIADGVKDWASGIAISGPSMETIPPEDPRHYSKRGMPKSEGPSLEGLATGLGQALQSGAETVTAPIASAIGTKIQTTPPEAPAESPAAGPPVSTPFPADPMQAATGGSGSSGVRMEMSLPVAGPAIGGGDLRGVRQAQRQISAASAIQQKAIQSAADVEKARLQQESVVKQTAFEEAQKLEAQRLQFESNAKQAREEKIQRIQQLSDDILKNKYQEDPNRFWASRSTGQRVAAGIAVFLGAFGRGENQALKILDAAVTRDIEAQRNNWHANQAQKKDALAAHQSLFGMMMAEIGDERAALSAARMVAKERVSQQIDLIASKSGAKEVQAKADMMKGQLAQSSAKDRLAVEQWSAQYGLNAANLRLQQMQFGYQVQAAQQKAQGKDPETYVPGLGHALDKESAKTVREMASNYNSVRRNLDHLKDLRKSQGGEVLDRRKVAAMRVAATKVIGGLNKVNRFGALDKGTQELLEKMVGGDVTSFGPGVDAALETLSALMDSDILDMTKPYMRNYEQGSRAQEAGFTATLTGAR